MHKMISTSFLFAMGVVLGVCSNFLAVALSIPPPAKPLFNSLVGYSNLLVTKSCTVVTVKDNAEYAAIRDIINPQGVFNYL